MNRQLCDTEDIITASEHTKSEKYKVIKGGVVIHETDDLNDAQRVCYAHHAVIAGKSILYFFNVSSSD